VQIENWDNIVHTISGLQAAQFMVRNSSPKVQTGHGAHPASVQWVPGYEVDNSPSFTTGQGFETSGAILYYLYVLSCHRQVQL